MRGFGADVGGGERSDYTYPNALER
jgi:hypothetical protein